MEAYNQASGQISQAPLFIDDTPALTPMQLRTRCRRLMSKKDLDLVVVDYLQLLNGGGRFENRTQEVSHISRSLKLIAENWTCPSWRRPNFLEAWTSATISGRCWPILSERSGAIEQDADIIMFLYRPEMYDEGAEKGMTKLSLSKQRNGPTGEINLYFSSSLTRFEDYQARTVRS